MVLGVILYFVFVTAVLAWCFLPPVRTEASTRALQALAWGRRSSQRWFSRPSRAARRPLQTGLAHARTWLHRQRVPLLATCAAIVLLPALALAVRSGWRFEGYDHTATRSIDTHVAALLQGEELVPPPALPPELFATQEVESAHPLARTASREWALLDAEFRRRLLLVFKLLKDRHGYDAVLIEGYRSPERQQALAQLGPAVTLAGANESYHQHGLAADVAFLREGRIVISERDPWAMRGYELYGELAASLGLVWGGHWRGLADYGHVELRRPGVLPARAAAASAAAATR